MTESRLLLGIASVFAGLAALLAVVALVSNALVVLVVAVPIGGTGVILWYHATGRLGARIRDRTRRRGMGRDTATGAQFGAGPRGDWRARERARDGHRGRGERASRPGPEREEAYRVLGLDPDADEAEVRAAYRERVKEVHPDTEDGNEESFKRVTRAYERLQR